MGGPSWGPRTNSALPPVPENRCDAQRQEGGLRRAGLVTRRIFPNHEGSRQKTRTSVSPQPSQDAPRPSPVPFAAPARTSRLPTALGVTPVGSGLMQPLPRGPLSPCGPHTALSWGTLLLVLPPPLQGPGAGPSRSHPGLRSGIHTLSSHSLHLTPSLSQSLWVVPVQVLPT